MSSVPGSLIPERSHWFPLSPHCQPARKKKSKMKRKRMRKWMRKRKRKREMRWSTPASLTPASCYQKQHQHCHYLPQTQSWQKLSTSFHLKPHMLFLADDKRATVTTIFHPETARPNWIMSLRFLPPKKKKKTQPPLTWPVNTSFFPLVPGRYVCDP